MGNTPDNPEMSAFPGELIDFEIDGGPEFDSYKVLKGPTDTDPLSCGKTVKTAEKPHTVKITLKATAMSLIPYVIMASSTSTYTPGTTQHPVTIGAMIGSEYCLVKGCVLANHEINFKDRKSVAELTLEFLGVERTDWGSDYVGSGSHASVVTAEPLHLSDVTNILYDSSALSAVGLILDSLKFGIKNNVEEVRDGSASVASQISSWNYTGREISIELGCTLTDMTIADEVLAGDNDHTVKFTVSGKTYTISSLAWTNAPTAKASAGELIGMNLTNDAEAARLAIA